MSQASCEFRLKPHNKMCIAIEFRMITIKQNDRSSECATYVPNKCTCPWYVCERIQHVAGKPTRSSCVGGETLSHFQPRPTLKTMASLIKDCRTAVSRLAPGMFFSKSCPCFSMFTLSRCLKSVSLSGLRNDSVDMDPHWWLIGSFFSSNCLHSGQLPVHWLV